MRSNTIEEFLHFSKYKLYMLSPWLEPKDDICLLSHHEINEIEHVVKASDGNIYDAFALHTWISLQETIEPHGCKFVIPGTVITHVTFSTWIEFSFKWFDLSYAYQSYANFSKKRHKKLHAIINILKSDINDEPMKHNKACQTDDHIHSINTQQGFHTTTHTAQHPDPAMIYPTQSKKCESCQTEYIITHAKWESRCMRPSAVKLSAHKHSAFHPYMKKK